MLKKIFFALSWMIVFCPGCGHDDHYYVSSNSPPPSSSSVLISYEPAPDVMWREPYIDYADVYLYYNESGDLCFDQWEYSYYSNCECYTTYCRDVFYDSWYVYDQICFY